ncbi:tRNA1(Val) (adenine(37)-N6)-methyltransferase [Pedobacter insulae]|uniref:tRNA1(Val) (adenine(37)-N6)-methyltransferase n=1 Tax=Pedobacter insulae TaxID=414048 RepID=A0A1I2VFQ0_9SPHI|nr:methyltransferase [Pedobacter insulae]SFG88164.1 tRNA1Val (adenine37-N6)-methyltransferase [Pedobacter insulae]
MSSHFKFKQFEVDQSGCAMKINTDGVLLAALAENENCLNILDIGTGTGVIALMLAQRFPKANIHAVEIDGDAAATADRNFKRSVFRDRLALSHAAIEKFDHPRPFNLIVCNPPYFVNDLKNAELKKGIARHADDQFFKDLIRKVSELLKPDGSFWFILPVKQAGLLIAEAAGFGLTVERKILLHSDERKPAFRWIVCLSLFGNEREDEHFYIYESERIYTKAYRALLMDFFLGY